MDRAAISFIGLRQTIDRITGNVKQAAVDLVTDRHSDRKTGIYYFHTTYQAFCRIHSYATNAVFAKVLLYLQYYFIAIIAGQFQCIVDLRKFVVASKVHVHHRADDLLDFTSVWHIRLY